MMRPDVLMGIAHELPNEQLVSFLDAMERSAFRYSRQSFAEYRSSGRFATSDFLARTAEVAAHLGWGVWHVVQAVGDERIVEVRNSPFAAGFGPSTRPVCAIISGVLRAIALIGYGQEAEVHEVECAAHSGNPACRFHIAAKPKGIPHGGATVTP